MRIAIQEPIAVANFIIEIANKEKKSITNLKLQKVMFFLQGYCLSTYGTPLMKVKFSKWRYGPVQVCAYDEFKVYASAPIDHGISTPTKKGNEFIFSVESLEGITEKTKAELSNVVKKIMEKEPWELVDMTHNHSSWKNFRTDIMNRRADDYTDDEIRSCYEENIDSLGMMYNE